MKDARSILGDGNGHRRLLPLVAVALLLIVGGVVLFTRGGEQAAPQTQAVAATEKADQVAMKQAAAPDERIDMVNALGLTQQQTIDQLQLVQDQVAAQQAEIRKLIDKVAMLSDKLEALQSQPSPAPTAALDVATPKTAHRR